jgi:hypothetical protein
VGSEETTERRRTKLRTKEAQCQYEVISCNKHAINWKGKLKGLIYY